MPDHEVLPVEYSKRLGVLTAEQLQAALDVFDLGTLVDAKAAPGGLFGQNVMITSTSGRYVLRGAPHEGQLAAERFFARVIHERSGAAAAWPYRVETSPEIFGWPFAIMPLLPGEHLSDPDVRHALSDDERVAVASAMGEGLGRLQEATWPVTATYDHAADALAPIDAPWDEWFVAKVRDWLDRCRRASTATTGADVEWIESVIDAARAALLEPFTPAIVHTDYTEGNVVVSRTGDGFRVVGVFDLAECYMGDGEYDLARAGAAYASLAAELAAAFVGAYAAARPLRAGFAERIRVYILADRLIFWEYGQRNGIWFTPGMAFREWAEPFVQRRLV